MKRVLNVTGPSLVPSGAMFGVVLRATAVIVAVASLLMVPGPALAQTAATGTIEGVVKDATGGALPGVTVVVKNVDTNQTRELVTDDTGRYRATALQPGIYEVTATLGGFQPPRSTRSRSSSASPCRSTSRCGRRAWPRRSPSPPNRRSSTRCAPTSATSSARRRFRTCRSTAAAGRTSCCSARRHQRRQLRSRELPRHLGPLQQQHGGRRRQQPGVLLRGARPHPDVVLDQPGGDQGIPGRHQQLLGRVRPRGRRHGERGHQVGHEQRRAARASTSCATTRSRRRIRSSRRASIARGAAPPVRRRARRRRSSRTRSSTSSTTTSSCATSPTSCVRAATRSSRGACTAAGMRRDDRRSTTALSDFYPREGNNEILLGKVDFALSNKHNLTVQYNMHRWDSPNGVQTQPIISVSPTRQRQGRRQDRLRARDAELGAVAAAGSTKLRVQIGRDFEAQQPNGTGPSTTVTNGIDFGMPELPAAPEVPGRAAVSVHRQRSTTMPARTASRPASTSTTCRRTSSTSSRAAASTPTAACNASRTTARSGDRLHADARRRERRPASLHHASRRRSTCAAAAFHGDVFFTTTDYNWFVQDTWRVSRPADAEPRPALRVPAAAAAGQGRPSTAWCSTATRPTRQTHDVPPGQEQLGPARRLHLRRQRQRTRR